MLLLECMQPGLLPLDTGEVDRGRRLEAREPEKGWEDAEAAFGNLVGRLAADAEGQDDWVVSKGAVGFIDLRIVPNVGEEGTGKGVRRLEEDP